MFQQIGHSENCVRKFLSTQLSEINWWFGKYQAFENQVDLQC